MEHVIIGVSAAGIAAAKAIRQTQPQSGITMISLDDRVYSRVKLHQYLSGESGPGGIGFVPEDFFEKNSIRWIKGVGVTGVSTAEKCVRLEDGRMVAYDKLLIASGADYFVPPLPHFREAGNVYGLRTIFDAEKLIEAAKEGSRCVIIGSGLVGLDAASALARRKVKVTLVEMADRLSPLQLDQRAAQAYQSLFEEQGCRFRFSAKAAGGKTDEKGNLIAVLLEGGEELPCDFVIVAAGVRSAVGFLENSGIALDRGVKVDAFMRTNVEDVFGAGDAAGVVGFWMGASRQGEVAGKNMCGGREEYVHEEPRNALNYYGLPTVSMGKAPEGGEVFTRDEGRVYQRITLVDGAPVHAVLQGDISKAMLWQKLIQNGTKVMEKGKSLFELTAADFA